MYVKFGKSTAGNSFKNSKLHAMLEECILIHSVHPPPPPPSLLFCWRRGWTFVITVNSNYSNWLLLKDKLDLRIKNLNILGFTGKKKQYRGGGDLPKRSSDSLQIKVRTWQERGDVPPRAHYAIRAIVQHFPHKKGKTIFMAERKQFPGIVDHEITIHKA